MELDISDDSNNFYDSQQYPFLRMTTRYLPGPGHKYKIKLVELIFSMQKVKHVPHDE
jgi:hypothetical protein